MDSIQTATILHTDLNSAGEVLVRSLSMCLDSTLTQHALTAPSKSGAAHSAVMHEALCYKTH